MQVEHTSEQNLLKLEYMALLKKEVWLALRTDGQPGNGDKNNPFNVSTVDTFDQKMRDFLADVDVPYYIHLYPNTYYGPNVGPYLTKGGYVNSTTGWKMGDGWTIAGAGIGATTIKLTVWNNSGGGKHYVVGVLDGNVRNLTVRDLTIDANWPNLTGKPPLGDTSVSSVAIYSQGDALIENVLSLHTYGDRLSEQECFSIFLSHPPGFDPHDFIQAPSTLTIRNCVAQDGYGDYVVGMTAFSRYRADMRGNVCRNLPNGVAPTGQTGPFKDGASPSSAFQFTGRGITFTENQTFNCPVGLYFDTGNIYDALIANNQFHGCRWAGLLTNPANSFFAINVRQNDDGGSLDGKYVDIPIKPTSAPDGYVVRVWLAYQNGGSTEPATPNPGKKIKVGYAYGAVGSSATAIKAAIVTALGNDSLFTDVQISAIDGSTVTGKPSILKEPTPGIGVWARNSGMWVSDPSVFYAQRGYEFGNWLIDGNFIEIEQGYWTAQQYGVRLGGTGSPACRDYTLTNNVVRFTPVDYTPGNQVYSYTAADTAGNLTLIENRTELRLGYFGDGEIHQLPGATRCLFGNRVISGTNVGDTIPGLADAGALPLTNTLPAVENAQQVSPAVRWTGQGWSTDFDGASQSVEFRAYLQPNQGTVNPSGTWILESSVNGSPFRNPLAYNSDGTLTLPGGISSGGAVVAASFNGPIGTTTPGAGEFTTLYAIGEVRLTPTGANVLLAPVGAFLLLTPANGDVVIYPAGTGKTTINCSVAGTIDNIDIGTATPRSGIFTSVSGNGGNITNLNASNLVSGIVPIARLPIIYGRVTSDWTSGSSSYSDVPGLSFSIATGTNWTAEVVIHAISGSTGQGFKFRVTGPSASSVMIAISGTGTSGTTTTECEVQTAFSAIPSKTFCQGSNLTGVIRIHIVVINGGAGTVQLQANNTSGSGTVTIKTNSDILAHKTN